MAMNRVTPPHMRSALSPPLLACITREEIKDLTFSCGSGDDFIKEE